jgi:hypothetical protein
MQQIISKAEYRKLTAPSEHEEQVTFIRWCDTYAYKCADLAYVVAIPNGGKRSIGVARKMKAEGQKAGYPDLQLDVACGPYHGWKCELKKIGGRVTKATQTPWHDRLRAQGCRVDVCVGWEAAARALVAYLGHDAREFGL